MPTVEEALIANLTQHAESLPPDPRLLSTVKERSHRVAVRNRVALVATAAAVVAAVVAVPSVAADLGIHGPALGGSRPAAHAGDFLVDGPFLPPAFPLTPTYLPAGVQPQPKTRGDINQWATWAKPGASRPTWLEIATLEDTGQSGATPGSGSQHITVHGRPGTRTVMSGEGGPATVTVIGWLRKPGQYVEVTGVGEFQDAQLLMRVAEGLVDKPLTGRWSFAVQQAPATFTLTGWDDYRFTMRAPLPAGVAIEAPPAVAALNTEIKVEANRISAGPARYGKPVTVGDRSGWVKATSQTFTAPGGGPNATLRVDALVLTLQVSDSTVLEFTTTGAPWTLERLMAFAAGVSYDGDTPPMGVND